MYKYILKVSMVTYILISPEFKNMVPIRLGVRLKEVVQR